MIEEFMAKQILVETGRDLTGKPIISIYACHFPDRKKCNYDALLRICIRLLEPFADQEYIVIFFAQPLHVTPPCRSFVDAYRELTRKFKKNIVKMYIVHPSSWFSTLVGFMANVLSIKFFKKKLELIHDLDALDSLNLVPRAEIPPMITGFDRGLVVLDTEEGISEAKEALPSIRVVGARVESVAPKSGIPPAIYNLVKELERRALDQESLFRIPPDQIELDQLMNSIDKGYNINFEEFSVEALASALKSYYRNLPFKLFPETSLVSFETLALKSDPQEQVKYINKIIMPHLSPQKQKLCGFLCLFLRKVADNEEKTLMNAPALAAIWANNLVHIEDERRLFAKFPVISNFVMHLINNANELFGEMEFNPEPLN